MAPSRMVGWHQLGGGFEGNGHGLVLVGTRPSTGSGSFHGVANPSQKMESVSALLKSSPQAGISYIRRRLILDVRILFLMEKNQLRLKRNIVHF